MNYIILDMEWDGSFFPKEKRFINQIIQIGAVKLDEKFNIVDTFEKTIKSAFSRRVSGRFSTLTGITSDDMRRGVPLYDAVRSYNEWIGDDTITMTWSNSDLYTAIENEKSLLGGYRFRFDRYLDLQKYIQNEMNLMGIECKSQIALGNAAEILGVTTDNLELHTAKDDSLLCAALLKKFYNKKRFWALVKDTSEPEFFDRLYFKSYYIKDIDSEFVDREQLKFKCPKCGQLAQRISKWRSFNNCFNSKFICQSCKYEFCGRISFKKTYDDVIIKKRAYSPKPKETEEKKNDLQSLSEKM